MIAFYFLHKNLKKFEYLEKSLYMHLIFENEHVCLYLLKIVKCTPNKALKKTDAY